MSQDQTLITTEKPSGVRERQSYTLNTIDRHGVYAVDQGAGKSSANVTKDVTATLACTHGGEPAICSYQDKTGPLMASGYEKNGTQEAMSDMYVTQDVYSFDQSAARYAGSAFKNVATTVTNGTAPGYHSAVAYGVDVYNQEITGDKAASLTAASGGTNTSGPKVMCLNDQGGQQMSVSQGVTATLRAAEHGHQPCVVSNAVVCAGFCPEESAKARGVGYEEEQSPSLRAGVVPGVMTKENGDTT